MPGLGRILGIGTNRLERMRMAWSKGDDCPLDGRLHLAKHTIRCDRLQTKKRELIYDFLTGVYLKHSEPMPEVQTDVRIQTNKKLRFRQGRGKRPKRDKKRNDKLGPEGVKALRMLPPGSYMDYYKLFLANHPDSAVSYKLFTRAAELNCSGFQK